LELVGILIVRVRYFDNQLTFDAAIVLVNSKSRRAKLANRSVILNNAGSVAWTALPFTGVDALIVDAGLVGRATPILETY
jgi:hypothetical protein